MKSYTFRVSCSFTMQYSFIDSEIEPDPEGGVADVVPTEAALSALQLELEAVLGEGHAISSISVDVESDDLLGVMDDKS